MAIANTASFFLIQVLQGYKSHYWICLLYRAELVTNVGMLGITLVSNMLLRWEKSMQADIMQRYARHQNAYATIVSFSASPMLPLRALNLKTGKQPGMHLDLINVTLR